MRTQYKRRYELRNPLKYKGNIDRITCRSSWEYAVCRYLDTNNNIIWWSSEQTIVPYNCATDGRRHRYFVDFTFQMKSGKTLMIEVKPYNQTQPPKKPSGKIMTKTYESQLFSYYKNISKWEAATEFAKSKGWEFKIWTEHEIAKLGIPLKGIHKRNLHRKQRSKVRAYKKKRKLLKGN